MYRKEIRTVEVSEWVFTVFEADWCWWQKCSVEVTCSRYPFPIIVRRTPQSRFVTDDRAMDNGM